MKEFEVTLQLRNNRLKERRLKLGLTQFRLAEAASVPKNIYMGLETLKIQPFTLDGEWNKAALALADFHCVEPRELFPEAVARVTQSRSVRRMSSGEIEQFIGAGSVPALPSSTSEKRMLWTAARGAVANLSPQETMILTQRFGLDGDSEKTLEEIGKSIGRSGQRVREIERAALNKLRFHLAQQGVKSKEIEEQRDF